MNKQMMKIMGAIVLGFFLGLFFPRFYLLFWVLGFGVAFVLAWPELKAGYAGRANRVAQMRKKGKKNSST